jgi:two-component system phosphate regulon sensor histidine kinase PhoR
MSPESLSFAYGLIEAVPDCACLYLSATDLLIPNRRWKAEVGDMTRLADLARIQVNPREVARVLKADDGGDSEPIGISVDEQGNRRLLVSRVQGQDNLFFLFVRDETELRRVEQLRKDFIANVSHELRTPLTAVRGYVETLLDPKFLTVERVREFMPVIFEHTERLHNLMLDLLSLSRLENPNTRIELAPIPLLEEIEDAIEATAPLAKMKNLQIEFRPPAESLRVLANGEHLERVLVNLLDNAIKYSEPGDRINVWTEADDGLVWTHVRDEGQGIAAEELPRVFERFYRTKGALSGRTRGSGLGLAIGKHIVQQLGGEIGVSSTLGEGSDFYFSLRLAPGNSTVPQEGRAASTR